MHRFLVALCLLAIPASAEDDVFAFMPQGGRTILAGLLADHPEATASIAIARPAADWMAAFAKGASELPGSNALDEWQRQTLADYLGYAGALVDPATLPPDGRDMALARCQSCHIITVVVTQSRPRDAWLGTMAKPSHVGVPLTPEERGQLADYLVVNGGISIDDVPPALAPVVPRIRRAPCRPQSPPFGCCSG